MRRSRALVMDERGVRADYVVPEGSPWRPELSFADVDGEGEPVPLDMEGSEWVFEAYGEPAGDGVVYTPGAAALREFERGLEGPVPLPPGAYWSVLAEVETGAGSMLPRGRYRWLLARVDGGEFRQHAWGYLEVAAGSAGQDDGEGGGV